MRKLTLDTNDLAVQSFDTAGLEATLRGTIAPGDAPTVTFTCGNPPAGADGGDGPTADIKCCV